MDRAGEGTLTAAIYARVSTDEQAEHGTSLGAQSERCRAYAASQGWQIAGEFVDEGVSGAKASRPALDRLLSAVREGVVDTVIVAKLDRLGRSMRHLAALLGELDDRSVRLVSVAEAFDSSTPSGRLQRNILGSFAEFEREQIRERTTSGLAAIARQGYWTGGPPPYGWRTTSAPDAPHRVVLEIHEPEADVLRVAIDAVVKDNLSTLEVARRLNATVAPPRRSPRWSGHIVRHLLMNLPLSGEWTWRRGQDGSGRKRRADGPPVTLTIPALIDRATHERLLAILADRSTGPRSAMQQHFYLLSRRVQSPHRVRMQGVPKTADKRWYVCKDALATAVDRCDCRRLDAETLEAAVWAEIVELLSDPDRVRSMANTALGLRPRQRAAEEQQIAALDRKIHRTEEELSDHIVDLIARGVDRGAVDRAIQKVDQRLGELRRQRSQLAAWQETNRHNSKKAEKLLDLVAEAAANLEAADQLTRRRLVDLLDITVHVVRWDPCPTCNAKGILPKVDPKDRRRRYVNRHGLEDLRYKPLICPTCRRSRYIAKVAISGTLPLDPVDASTPEVAGVPFETERALQAI